MANTITFTAQNGRDGVSVLLQQEGDLKVGVPARGRLESLGRKAAHDCFKFTPDESGDWVLLAKSNVEAPEGSPARVVGAWDLQGNGEATLLVARPGALLRFWGYRRRDVEYRVLMPDGGLKLAPPAVVASLLGGEPAPVEPPPEMEEDGPLARALRASGLI
jgi:hypothetical protein